MNNDDQAVPPIPEESVPDKLIRLGNAFAGEWPGGGTLAAFVTLFIETPIERRSREWMEYIHASVEKLLRHAAEHNIPIDLESEAFLTVLIRAREAVVRTHKAATRRAFRNVVLNAALPNTPADDLQLMLLNMLDAFTPVHLLILGFYNDPAGFGFQRGDISPEEIGEKIVQGYDFTQASYFFRVFPNLEDRGHEPLIRTLTSELESHALIERNEEDLTTEEAPYVGRKVRYKITSVGSAFIDFIASPLPGEEDYLRYIFKIEDQR